MRFPALLAVCALLCCLLQASPSPAATPLRTAWLGEHEAFLVWYAKEKGWDKEAGLDISMLRFDSGKSLIENIKAYDWAIAGCGAVPAMQATMSDRIAVIGIANDESRANAILVRPDSPVLQHKGSNPDFPNVFGSAASVKGKIVLCPKRTSARYLLDRWLAALGLAAKDVVIEELDPTPALGGFKNGYGDILSIWAPYTREAEHMGFQVAARSQDCGALQPVLLVADREFAERDPAAVQAFLQVYLRVVEEIRRQGPRALAPDYVRFAEEWMHRSLSVDDAVADLTDHPVFSLAEQLEFFAGKDGGRIGAQLREIVAFSERMNPGTTARHAAPDAVTDRFLRALQQESK